MTAIFGADPGHDPGRERLAIGPLANRIEAQSRSRFADGQRSNLNKSRNLQKTVLLPGIGGNTQPVGAALIPTLAICRAGLQGTRETGTGMMFQVNTPPPEESRR
jgi:hypothetical protein